VTKVVRFTSVRALNAITPIANKLSIVSNGLIIPITY
jgi:hypothetical protein